MIPPGCKTQAGKVYLWRGVGVELGISLQQAPSQEQDIGSQLHVASNSKQEAPGLEYPGKK